MDVSIFKAYDVRGLYPTQVNQGVAFALGLALGKHFKKSPLVIARDGRIGSPELYRSVLNGLRRSGRATGLVEAGLTTTPMFYYLVQKMAARGGIMITASHNPGRYNGFKVVGKNAEMISGKKLLRIMNKEL
ncbi:MAG TPA: hypothetical protein VNK70_01995 [Candidatus Paceibacterota bacterium]|nr:hypothetical protein [Candidatus Paceibacterota bacterium]